MQTKMCHLLLSVWFCFFSVFQALAGYCASYIATADQVNPGPETMGCASLGILYHVNRVGVLSFFSGSGVSSGVERQTVMTALKIYFFSADGYSTPNMFHVAEQQTQGHQIHTYIILYMYTYII